MLKETKQLPKKETLQETIIFDARKRLSLERSRNIDMYIRNYVRQGDRLHIIFFSMTTCVWPNKTGRIKFMFHTHQDTNAFNLSI